MNRKSKLRQGKEALDIIEEAVHLLRTSSPSVLALYYIGSLPFVLGLLYFWADMSRSAFAYTHCAEAAFGLALLFLWMKSWQAAFAQRLKANICGRTTCHWTIRRIAGLVTVQTIIQPWGIFVLPIALIIGLPFGWAYAFYQNATVLGDGHNDVGTILKKSWRQATLWPKQNHIIIWLLSPWLLVVTAILALVLIPFFSALSPEAAAPSLLFLFLFFMLLIPLCPLGIVSAANIGLTIFFIPQLLKMFFGIETIFTLSGPHIMNSTFFAAVCAITYVCIDPLVKAGYVLRCFYGESVRTGEDLKVELRRFRAPATLTASVFIFLLLYCGVPNVTAAASSDIPPSSVPALQSSKPDVSAQELDQAISTVINQPEYAWRMPRENDIEEKESETGILAFISGMWDTLIRWCKPIKHWIRKVLKWLKELFSKLRISRNQENSSTHWAATVQRVLFVLLAVVGCMLAVLLWRAWKARHKQHSEVKGEEILTTPDLVDDGVDANELPEDGWRVLAGELMEKGELRLALRALFLAGLAFLAGNEMITIAKFKSNRDYERELRRRAHGEPRLIAAFAEHVTMFERVWYGMHEVTRQCMKHFAANHEKLRSYAKS